MFFIARKEMGGAIFVPPPASTPYQQQPEQPYQQA